MYVHPFIKCFVFLKTLNLHLEEIDNNPSAQLIFCPNLAYTRAILRVFYIFFLLLLLLQSFVFYLGSVTEFLLKLQLNPLSYNGHLGDKKKVAMHCKEVTDVERF